MLMAIQNLYRSLRSDDLGSELIEFALSGGLVMMVILAIMDGSRAVYADHFVANAAREASRYAMVHGATYSATPCSSTVTSNCMATSSDVLKYIQGMIPTGLTSSNLQVNTTWPGTTPSGASCMWSGQSNSPGCVANVQVKYSFKFLFSFLPAGSLSLNSASSVTIEQ